jgi:hypothetical protein
MTLLVRKWHSMHMLLFSFNVWVGLCNIAHDMCVTFSNIVGRINFNFLYQLFILFKNWTTRKLNVQLWKQKWIILAPRDGVFGIRTYILYKQKLFKNIEFMKYIRGQLTDLDYPQLCSIARSQSWQNLPQLLFK